MRSQPFKESFSWPLKNDYHSLNLLPKWRMRCEILHRCLFSILSSTNASMHVRPGPRSQFTVSAQPTPPSPRYQGPPRGYDYRKNVSIKQTIDIVSARWPELLDLASEGDL